MAKVSNLIRNTTAKLGQATIDKYGNTFAVQFGLDGINIANVTVKPMTSSIIPYLEGDDTITKYAVPINVDELCDYALASFPNIEELTLFSLTMVTFDETNLLEYLPNLTTVYVPQSLLSAYQSAYPNITFDEITVDYTYVLEDYTQDHVLTSAIVTEQLNTLTSQQRNAITKLVIASTYTSASAESVAWGYNFGTLLIALDNKVWYNGQKYDFTTRELSGVDELLESDITNLINGISSDKKNGVTQLKFSGFSDMSVALTYDYSALSNLEYVWLDNVRYELVSGELINQTYFYPISDLVSEYDARLTQTFYLDYNGTLPTISSDYQVTWYSDINCTTTILPENMVSGNRYYAKVVMVTLTLQGSGTLTKAMVEEQAQKAGSYVTKVLMGANLTINGSSSTDTFSTLDTLFPNIDTLLIRNSGNIYITNMYNGTKVKTMLLYGGSYYFGNYNSNVNKYYQMEATSLSKVSGSCFTLPQKTWYFKELTTIGRGFCNGNMGTDINSFPKLTTINGGIYRQTSPLYYPKLTTIANEGMTRYTSDTMYLSKLFIGTKNCSIGTDNTLLRSATNLYVRADSLVTYLSSNGWENYNLNKIGVIDGNNVYRKSDDYISVDFEYPKLTGIDTEANIQLLTPTEDVLYLASDTGNLWQYDSANSLWTNLFSGYTPTWYSDEDCTTSILASAMDTTHTYYVKLTAI